MRATAIQVIYQAPTRWHGDYSVNSSKTPYPVGNQQFSTFPLLLATYSHSLYDISSADEIPYLLSKPKHVRYESERYHYYAARNELCESVRLASHESLSSHTTSIR